MSQEKKNGLKKSKNGLFTLGKTALSLLLVPLLVFTFSACTPQQGAEQTSSGVAESGAPQSGAAETQTITDMAGRSVEIPTEVKTIAYTYGVAGNVLFTFGAGDLIVGVQGSNDFFEMLSPDIANATNVGRNEAVLETLADLAPDIYINRSDRTDDLEAVAALGIPAIGISAENLDEINQLYTLMGQILGEEDKATELIEYYTSLFDKAKGLVSDLTDDQKVTAILMGGDIGEVAHAQMIQSDMITAAGGVSLVVGSDVPTNQGTWPKVGTETIFSWNPDFIFLTNNRHASYTADDLLNDPTWANVQAVIDKNIYTVPSEKDSWEFPGLGSSLGTLWMVSKMYPDKLSEADFNEIVQEFYKKIYNIDGTPEVLGF